MRDVEKKGAARSLQLPRKLAGQAVADVVLRAEDVCDLSEDLGLVIANPQQLGQRKVGQRRVAGELDEPLEADLLRQPVALWLRPLIAPDERWTEYFAIGVQHHAAVHLAGQADSLNLGAGKLGGSHGSRNGFARRAPPVLGILLCPPDVLRVYGRMFAGE